MKKMLLVLSGCVVAMAIRVNSASALPQFKKAFEDKYVKTSKDGHFKTVYKKASCNACHVKGQKKSVHNKYGKELAELIKGDAKDRLDAANKKGDKDKVQEEILKELEAAFKQVEKKKPSDESLTFGERLKNGQLPVEVK
jgi:cytochrome c553